jgi:hypothetical protein
VSAGDTALAWMPPPASFACVPDATVIPGVRQVSKTRLHEPIEQLAAHQLAGIGEALTLYLND